MKKLDKQKKLVLETLLGKEVVKDDLGLLWIFERGEDRSGLLLDEWNPQDNKEGRKHWDEIWEEMDADFFHAYIKSYDEIPQSPIERTWRIHTAKPSVCWPALITTLNEK